MASTSAGHIILHQQDLQQLLGVTARLREQRTLMNRIGRAVHSDTMMRFRAGKAPDGTPWLALKTRQGQPLRDTGRLQRSITWESDASSATIGTNVVYARAHNVGVPGKLPRRQFLGIAQPQVTLINRIADQWLKEVLDGNPA
jgi:phage virion morphogenesis protein